MNQYKYFMYNTILSIQVCMAIYESCVATEIRECNKIKSIHQ